MKTALKDKWAMLNVGLGLVAASISFWPIAYAEIDMTELSFVLTWALTALFVGCAGVAFLKKSSMHAAMLTTAGFIASALIRIIFELVLDPTTHNLFPFEIMLTVLSAFPSSFAGAYATSLLFKKSK